MRICHLDPLFYPYFGGSEKVVYEISRRLAKRHGITVLTSQIPGTQREERLEGINIKRVPCIYFERLPFSFLPPPFSLMPTLNLEIMRERADVFHIHNRFWYYFGTMATLKLLKGAKLAITLHNAKPEGIDFLTDMGGLAYYLLVGRRWMEIADAIIAVSEYTRNVTVPRRLHEKVHVIHNGVDVERFRPRPERKNHIRKKFAIGKNSFLVLANARLIAQKGYPYLIEAFAMLRKKHRNARMIMIGKGPLKGALESMCRRKGIEKDVHFVTGIPEAELPLYYNAADVFALPSLWEPYGLVLSEALGSGVPVVATNVGGIPEVITPDCGLLCQPRSAKGLFDSIEALYHDETERQIFGKNARRRALEEFSWDLQAEKYETVYESIR